MLFISRTKKIDERKREWPIAPLTHFTAPVAHRKRDAEEEKKITDNRRRKKN